MCKCISLFSRYFWFMSTKKTYYSIEIPGSSPLRCVVPVKTLKMSRMCCWVFAGAALSRKCFVFVGFSFFLNYFFPSKCSNMLSGFAATLAALTVFTLIPSLKGQLRSQPLLCQVQHKKRQTGKSMKCNSVGWPLAGKTGVRQCFKDLGFTSNTCERGYSPACCSCFWPGWWWKLHRRHKTLPSRLMLLAASMPDENRCEC